MIDLICKWLTIVTLFLCLFICPVQTNAQLLQKLGLKKSQKQRPPRLERKALKYEESIRKNNQKGRDLLENDEVNYAKLDNLKRKTEKLSLKAQKCRYKLKSKRHIKVQDRATKKRMRKGLKHHRKYKANRRNRR